MAFIQSASKGIKLPTIVQVTGGTDVTYPFTLTVTSDGSNYIGNITPGTINGSMPSNVLTPIAISGAGLTYIYLNTILNNAAVASSIFVASVVAPAPYPVTISIPPTTLGILTHIVLSGVVYRVIGLNNITVTPNVMFETDKTSYMLGNRLTDFWYSYKVTS